MCAHFLHKMATFISFNISVGVEFRGRARSNTWFSFSKYASHHMGLHGTYIQSYRMISIVSGTMGVRPGFSNVWRFSPWLHLKQSPPGWKGSQVTEEIFALDQSLQLHLLPSSEWLQGGPFWGFCDEYIDCTLSMGGLATPTLICRG